MDVSANLVSLAAKQAPSATVSQANLERLVEVQAAVGARPGSKADVGCCANVLISPETNTRARIIANIRHTLKSGAKMIWVVPSLESAIFCEWRWLRSGPCGFEPSSTDEAIPATRGVHAQHILAGTLKRDGVRTKHYLREEFETTMQQSGFRVERARKVRYGWDMEFGDANSVPRHIQLRPDPGPWDWLFETTRL
jgi:hypothetical protein